jgi:hypothetical protein
MDQGIEKSIFQMRKKFNLDGLDEFHNYWNCPESEKMKYSRKVHGVAV